MNVNLASRDSRSVFFFFSWINVRTMGKGKGRWFETCGAFGGRRSDSAVSTNVNQQWLGRSKEIRAADTAAKKVFQLGHLAFPVQNSTVSVSPVSIVHCSVRPLSAEDVSVHKYWIGSSSFVCQSRYSRRNIAFSFSFLFQRFFFDNGSWSEEETSAWWASESGWLA